MRSLVCLLASAAWLFAAGELSNRRAPGFNLTDMNLNQYDLQDFRGKVVLIDFMETQCPHCGEFSGVLEVAKTKYGDKLVILTITTYPPDNQITVRNYIEKNKVTTPILFDCGQVKRSYLAPSPKDTRTSAPIPHVFLIDRQGKIRYDRGFSEDAHSFFDGPGLFTEIDRIMGPQAPKKATKP